MAELALYLPGILAAYAILLVGGFSPGPSVALLLGVGGAQGRHAALVTTLGIVAGSVSLNILTLIGVGVLVEQTAWAVTILRYVGAAYLAWLAYGALRKAVSPPDLSETTPPAKGTRALFATGAALHLTNPKAIVFWIAMHAVAGLSGAPLSILAGFVLGAALISFACHAAWAVLFSTNGFRAAYARARRWIEAALGGFLGLIALRLATERSL